MLEQIVAAVEHVESRGDPTAVSRDGCVGLMQINPKWSKYTAEQLKDPEINRAEGKRLLRYWYRQARGSWLLTLAAYRCGWGGLKGRCGVKYARVVMARVKHNKGEAHVR